MRISGLLIGAAALTLASMGCRSTPKFQGYTADELYAFGQRASEAGEWSEAVEALELLISFDPNYTRMGEARLLLADAYFQKEDYLTAASEYIRILSRYPGTELQPRAALGVCRAYVGLSPIPQRDQTHTIQALNSCRNTANDYPGREEGHFADSLAVDMAERLAEKGFQTGEFYFSRDFFDSARVYYEQVVGDWPSTSFAPRSLLRLYELFVEIGYDDLAEEARTRLLREYPESESARTLPAVADTTGAG
ncbi:MAG: outer membrane protein assembly factor BamD [Gemmatimonadota bacterium]